MEHRATAGILAPSFGRLAACIGGMIHKVTRRAVIREVGVAYLLPIASRSKVDPDPVGSWLEKVQLHASEVSRGVGELQGFESYLEDTTYVTSN